MIRILTLSNKPKYLPDAINSVLSQTRRDIVHVIGFDSERSDWGDRYPPAVFFNEEARKADKGDYIAWLSDDDILLPNYVELLAGFLDDYPYISAVYGRARIVLYDYEKEKTELYSIPQDGLPIYNGANLPCRKIGSGNTMVRREVFDRLKWPWATESADSARARVSDGELLNEIAKITPIHPLGAFVVVINRITPQSAHQYCTSYGAVGRRDWRELIR